MVEARKRVGRLTGMTGTDRGTLTAQVRAYLRDCRANPQLDPRYHPTPDGAVKLIWHRGQGDADAIREAYARETAMRHGSRPIHG